MAGWIQVCVCVYVYVCVCVCVFVFVFEVVDSSVNILRLSLMNLSYGRRMMTGLLSSEGMRVSQLRVGQALQRVNPHHHHHRQTRMYRMTNPVSYRSEYFGEKLHIDQNEKLVMFGVTHVCAVGGHSGLIPFAKKYEINNVYLYYD